MDDRSAQLRTKVKRLYGAALADKATDALCSSLVGEVLPESVAGGPGRDGTVLELDYDQDLGGGAGASPEDVGDIASLRSAHAALAEVAAQWPTMHLDIGRTIRQAGVRRLREASHAAADPVVDALDRLGGGLLGPAAESAARTAPVTQLCWLNGTMRSFADPRAVAEVADAPSVRRIDVPRRLEAELHGSSITVGAPAFRQTSGSTGKGIIVAVLDGEVSLHHPGLAPRVVHRNNYTAEPWGNPHPHGTAVAGFIAADGPVVQGVAPEATIYSYKVLAPAGLGADDFGGAMALMHALEDGAHVANCSWGTPALTDGRSREARAFDTAWSLGLTIVKSAGNRGSDPGTVTAPSDADGVIVVGATNRAGTAVEDYSSRGPARSGAGRPHLVAPGGSHGDGLVSLQVGGGTGDVTYGTSFAAPHVAGLIALLLEGDPELTPDALRDRLLACCTPLAGVPTDAQGAGLVSLAALV